MICKCGSLREFRGGVKNPMLLSVGVSVYVSRQNESNSWRATNEASKLFKCTGEIFKHNFAAIGSKQKLSGAAKLWFQSQPTFLYEALMDGGGGT